LGAVEVAVVQSALCLIEETANLGDGFGLVAVEVVQGIDAALGGVDEVSCLLARSAAFR
jgi:hypothetical protein